jgi:hypothetical protein
MMQPLRRTLLLLWLLLSVLPGAAEAVPLRDEHAEPLPPPLSPETLIAPQIVGGREARLGEVPWQVALVLKPYVTSSNYYFGQVCGGSLIAPQWVLTAAHCMVYAREDLAVVGGLTDLRAPTAQTQLRSVSRIIVHPRYNSATFANDLALLQLERPIEPNGALSVIAPATAADTPSGQRSVISGWGSIVAQDSTYSLPPSYPAQLQYARVPLVDNATCDAQIAALIGRSGAVLDSMVCAGWPEGGRDACQADSGGPLVVNGGDGWRLAGVVSFGVGCAQPAAPGVYTRVSSYAGWIERHVTREAAVAAASATAACQTAPDVAVSPQYIRLDPGGSAQIDIAVRNTNPAAYGTADLLLSLSDGLQVAEATDGIDLGGRAAWQGLTLGVNETSTFSLTVLAADELPTAPIFVAELYCGGRVQSRIDGVMLSSAQYAAISGAAAGGAAADNAAAAASATVSVVAAGAAAAAPLPQQLPLTAGGAAGDVTLIGVLAGIALLIGRRLQQNGLR